MTAAPPDLPGLIAHCREGEPLPHPALTEARTALGAPGAAARSRSASRSATATSS